MIALCEGSTEYFDACRFYSSGRAKLGSFLVYLKEASITIDELKGGIPCDVS